VRTAIAFVAGLALAAAGGVAAGQLAAQPGIATATSPTFTETARTAPTETVRGERGRKSGRAARPARQAQRRAAAPARREPGEDLRGPCDEAENANDPRCAPGGSRALGQRGGERERQKPRGRDRADRRPRAEAGRDDRGRGRGRGGRSGRSEDRSGSNRGRG
jgi:hypothetical protein